MPRNLSYHVCHLIASRGLYGAEKWILAFFRAAKKFPIKMTLINLSNEKHLRSDIVQAANKIGLHAFDLYTGGRFNPKVVLRVNQWLKTDTVEILHSHGYKSDTVALLVKSLTRVKTVTTPHGWSLERDLKLWIYEKLDRHLFHFMDAVCPLSPELYSDLLQSKFLATKLQMILNGVDIEEIDSTKNTIYTDPKIFSIGYVGQLIKRKNIPSLFKAVQKVLRLGEKVTLTLVGDGPEKVLLQNECDKLGISSSVRFCGFRRDALQILKAFDLLVLPSLQEGIPRCVMEAMTARVPVIASNIPGTKNLVIDGKTGILFAPRNTSELADKILYVLNNRNSVQKMVTRARKKVQIEFSNHKMVEKYVELYNRLVFEKTSVDQNYC